jgi:predicted nuclease with RNAse H fold
VRPPATDRRRPDAAAVCAGIDVGGPRKGFHAVALRGRRVVATFVAADSAALAAWVRAVGAVVVAVDAPGRWSRTGRARPAERELARRGFRCFATPTEAAARAHPKGWYDWMLAGAALYAALAPSHPLHPERGPGGGTACETFPHAVAGVLSGGPAPAGADKADGRRRLLRALGVDVAVLPGPDFVDAALCALTAQALHRGKSSACGDEDEGLIVLPAGAVRPLRPGRTRE